MTDKADPSQPTRIADGSDATRVARDGASAVGGPMALVVPRWTGPVPAGPVSAGGLSVQSAVTPEPGGGQSLLQPGMVLNNTQRIEALVGRGGMGEVYRATNIHTGDQDAIKVIRPDLASDPQVRELFRREAAALRKVRHPSVVSYEGVFGDDSGRLFLVMEFVDGPSLASVIAQAPLPPADVRRVGVQIAEGLAAAHACGVVHRDLSPDNVVLRGGKLDNAVLIDFGVAKRLDGGSTVVGSGFAGKLDYCSPEQCGLFDGVDHRTDIYSLGLVLAAAAVGKHLPMGSSLANAVKARETRPDLSSVPQELRADLARLLEPDPARRPQTMREVAALLGYGAAATFAPAVSAPSTARRVAWIAGGVVAMLGLFAGGVFIGLRLMAPADVEATASTGSVPDLTRVTAEQQRRDADLARQKAEDERRAAEARQQAERAAAEKRRLEEEAQRATEEAARRAEAERHAAEQQAAAEARRKADEDAQRQAAERAAADKRRADEEARHHAEEERRAAVEAQRKAEEARRHAEEQKRAAADAQHKAEEERRHREAGATPPTANPPAPPRPQQAARQQPTPPATVEGIWRGQICFRRLALTAGNETCGPLSLTVSAGGTASGSWVVNSLTYGVSGTLGGSGGQVTLDMPPTGRGSSLGAKFTLPVHLNGVALQGQGYTQNDVLVMFSAGR